MARILRSGDRPKWLDICRRVAAAALLTAFLPAADRAETLASAPDRLQLAQAQAPAPEETFDNVAVAETDLVVGEAGAPVTIVEYASLTCPACAEFRANVLPRLMKPYVETGKVRLVYRDFPLDGLALAAATLARCFDGKRSLDFIDLLFREQARWARGREGLAVLIRLARLSGVSAARAASCIQDEAKQRIVLEQRQTASRRFGISATPTLLVNGRKYSGGLAFDQLGAVIEALLSES